ncbi:MAG TPA: hypothetical protein VNK82_02825 [Terriglobales bacterium]|nr:hypothetical protein [Terriglobales bacterium]
MKPAANGSPSKRPYQKPELRKLSPAEAQARLREHAMRGSTVPYLLLHRPPQRGWVR